MKTVLTTRLQQVIVAMAMAVLASLATIGGMRLVFPYPSVLATPELQAQLEQVLANERQASEERRALGREAVELRAMTRNLRKNVAQADTRSRRAATRLAELSGRVEAQLDARQVLSGNQKRLQAIEGSVTALADVCRCPPPPPPWWRQWIPGLRRPPG